jgi:rhamnulokinase
MSGTADYIAIDLGASGGRVIAGGWDGARFTLRELHRFANEPVGLQGHLYWDVLRLWHEVKAGLARYAAESSVPPAGIGVDTWGVDFGLLDRAGRLLGNPYHYRDPRTDGVPEMVDQIVPPAEVYAVTGIQRMPINTLFQLFSMQRSGDPQLAAAQTLLLMPDLFHYFLTGCKVAEYTHATTTQIFDARQRQWAGDLLDRLGLPAQILQPVVQPGTPLGDLLAAVGEEVGLRGTVPVIATATHDTASAVAAVPGLDERSAYISSGTWSLVGVETAQPILTERARALNFTNEGGVDGMIRLLKNVGGLWLLQECRRIWRRQGHDYGWPELIALAEQAVPLRSIIDPDAPEFLHPADMPAAIQAYCRAAGQPEPDNTGAIVRCCLESLALKYRYVIHALEELLGHGLDTIRFVGGGSQNALLTQLTADATGRTVVAGPVEATALGNIMVQAVATGALPSIAAGRRAVRASFEPVVFQPRRAADWDTAAARLAALVAAPR